MRSAGAAMGYARESFGVVGWVGAGAGCGCGAVGLWCGVGAGGQAFVGESGVLDGHVAALGGHDQAGEQQLRDALAAAGVGRDRMDAVIAAAEADVAGRVADEHAGGTAGVGGRD